MKIIEINFTPVSVPYKIEERWHYGIRRGISNIIIEIKTDNDLIGIGEAVGFPSVNVILQVLKEMAPLFIDRDPHNIDIIIDKIYKSRGWYYFKNTANCAIGGIEMALWDLIGKDAKVPLYKLLGGLYKDKVEYYYHVPYGEITYMCNMAINAIKFGISTIYLKVGINENQDIEIVKEIRNAIGSVGKLRVDANEAWTVSEAIKMANILEQYNIEFVEQPVDMYDIDALRIVRESCQIPVAANQTSWNERDVLEIIKKQASDIIVTDQHQVAGISAFKRIAWLCELSNISIVKHSFGDLGISTSAGIHVLSTCKNNKYANQTHLHFLDFDIIKNVHQFDNTGSLKVPEGYGLGVDLNPLTVKEANKIFKRNGEFSPFEEV